MANDLTNERVMLLTASTTYRAQAFLEAASGLGLMVVRVADQPSGLLYRRDGDGVHRVAFADIDDAGDRLTALARHEQVSAVISVDDSATELAALVNHRLGLPSHHPSAAQAARDKYLMRSLLAAGGVKCPTFQCIPLDADPEAVARFVGYPCVVKPRRLSGSRGVIRANDPNEFGEAFVRTATIIRAADPSQTDLTLLVEDYLPGEEVAVEGLMTDDELTVLAIFDKPDPLEGPFFEETIYLTPSQHSLESQELIRQETAAAAAALGLRHGPIHAELRLNGAGAWLLEIAGRSIGGLCSTVLEFGSGISLEEIILRHAVGRAIPERSDGVAAAGVMMIPIPKSGILRDASGLEEARLVPGVTGVEITAKINYPIETLPEGSSYLGFIFAHGTEPTAVEAALRRAHQTLSFRIDPVISLAAEGR